MHQFLDIDDAMVVLRTVLERMSRQGLELPKSVVLVGGTALAAHGIRRLSKDVDFYAQTLDETIIYEVEEEFRQIHGRLFKIDATNSEAIWGRIVLKDLEKSPNFTTMIISGHEVEVKTLNEEDLFFLKLSADREKDRRDLPFILDRVAPEALVHRFNCLIEWIADKAAAQAFVARFVDVMDEHDLFSPGELLGRLNIPEHVKDMLLASRMMEENDGPQKS